MGKRSDFRISSSQVVDAWRILQFQRKRLYGFEGRLYGFLTMFQES